MNKAITSEENVRRNRFIPAGFFARSSNLVYFLAVFGISSIAYLLGICPTVEYIDSGELALACKNLGIAHPTGYPIYTVLGRLVSILPWGSLIQKMNLLSLVFTALAAGFLFLLVNPPPERRHEGRGFRQLASASIAVFTAFSPVWWAQGTTNEVYSLNLVLIAISIYCLLRYFRGTGTDYKWMLISSYTLGLSLANHLSALYLIPGYLYLIIVLRRKQRVGWKILIAATAAFLFPLSIYLFLPVRARFTPFLNWGDVDDLYFLYKHVSGWQYRVWMFSDGGFSLSVLLGKLADAGKLLFSQFGRFGILLILTGLWRMFSKEKHSAVFAVIIVVLNFIYASNYQITDIESYYLPMILVLAIFMTSGLVYVIGRINRSLPDKKSLKYIGVGLILIFPVSNFMDNFYQSDRSDKTFARQGTLDILSSMEPGGLAILENWDFYSPWLYLRYEENIRPDAVLLDKELMRRSWYIDFIRRFQPEIYDRSEIEFEEFLRRVEPFERGQRFDPDIIDRAYYGMLKAVIEHESELRPVYSNVITDSKFGTGSTIAPVGILYKFAGDDEFLIAPEYRFDDRYWGNRYVYRDNRTAQLLRFYKTAFGARAKYCLYFKKNEEAAYYQNLTAKVSRIIAEISEN